MSEALAESTGTTGAAVIDPSPVQPPAPVNSVAPTPEATDQAEKPMSVRESVKAAREKIEAAEKHQKQPEKAAEKAPEAKNEAKPAERQPDTRREEAATKPAERREEQPTQTSQQDTTQQRAAHSTAPQRFSDDAKAAWETSPEPVKAEVHRAIRELEDGYKKHREAAEAYEPVREYDLLAKKHGTTIKDALDRYTNMERLLASEDLQAKVTAIGEVLRYAGVTPQQYAAYVTGMKPDEVQAQSDATINALRRQVEQLQQQIGGVTTTLKEQKETAVLGSVAKFAEGKDRFNELAPVIAKLINTGMADDLDQAYEMADRLNPGAAPARQEQKPAIDPAAQTRGEKSITGAPSAGSNPGVTKTAVKNPTIREAIRAAKAQVG